MDSCKDQCLTSLLLHAVWIQLACAFRYGREDLDVIGLSFRKDIWIQHIQLYPDAGHKPTLTEMHDTLLKKAGEQGHPFTFNVRHLPDILIYIFSFVLLTLFYYLLLFIIPFIYLLFITK